MGGDDRLSWFIASLSTLEFHYLRNKTNYIVTEKKMDRRPISTETTRSAPDVIIVSRPIRWLWPLGPPPWAPTPPHWPLEPHTCHLEPRKCPLEPRTCPEGSTLCYLDTRSVNFDSCEYYSQYLDQNRSYDYCPKSDYYKSQTLPRNLGSTCCKKTPRSVCFYGLEDECEDGRTFVVKADIEAPR